MPLLAPSWMPAPGSLDRVNWPVAADGAMATAIAAVGEEIRQHVRQVILQAGFTGSVLIGHSMGGALACVLAADPAIAAEGLVLLDSSEPMPHQRRADNLVRMGQWIGRAVAEGRSAAQTAWVAEQPNRTDHVFHSSERGPARALIERSMAHAPVVAAAAALGSYLQWPIDEGLQQVRCPVLAFAADPGRLPVAALRQARPDARFTSSANAATSCMCSQASVFAPTWSAGYALFEEDVHIHHLAKAPGGLGLFLGRPA